MDPEKSMENLKPSHWHQATEASEGVPIVLGVLGSTGPISGGASESVAGDLELVRGSNTVEESVLSGSEDAAIRPSNLCLCLSK